MSDRTFVRSGEPVTLGGSSHQSWTRLAPMQREGALRLVLAWTYALALGVATLGTLFLSLVPGMGMRDALAITLLAQLARAQTPPIPATTPRLPPPPGSQPTAPSCSSSPPPS